MLMITPLLIIGSILTSTCLILVNKQVMSVHDFKCPTFLTAYHFILTFSILQAMGRMRFFEIARSFPALEAWKMGFLGVASIVAMNFNLKTNSIGFYQLSKLCTIPCLVIYKFLALNQATPRSTLFSLSILLAGLYLFTVNDVQFNIIGSIIALVAVITTAAYQTMTGTLQKAFSVSGTQLNHAVGVPQFVLCLLAGFAIETRGENSILAQDFHLMQTVLVLLSGMFAVIGNVVGFSLIGRAGPVTFQVVGHVKTMLIFVCGLIMFPERDETRDQMLKKILGLTISMAGVILYTVFELQIKEAEKLAAEHMIEITNEPDGLEPMACEKEGEEA
jgi:solute carrier family 35 protein E3